MARNGINHKIIGRLHLNGGKEYISLQNKFWETIEKSISLPFTPELIGTAKRVKRTMVEATRSLLIQAKLTTCL